MGQKLSFVSIVCIGILSFGFSSREPEKSPMVFAPPEFTSSAPTGNIVYHRPFVYNFSTTDPDDDPIELFILSSPLLDANYLDSYNTSPGNSLTIWQSFTAEHSGFLASAGFLSFFSTNGSGGTVNFRILEGEGLSGTEVYSSNFHMPNAPGYNIRPIPDGTNILLTSGEKYTIVYTSLSTQISALYVGTASNPYAGGQSYFQANRDIPFQVHIRRIETTPSTEWLNLDVYEDGTGTLYGTPNENHVGAFSVALMAKAGGEYAFQSIDFSIIAPQQTVTKIQAIAKDESVELKWTKNITTNFSKYYIYGGTTSDPTTLLDSLLNINDTTFTITGLTNEAMYYFRIQPTDEFGYRNLFSPQTATVPREFGPVRSITFNGTNQRITLPNSTAYDTQHLTIEAWVYSEDYNQNGHIFEKGNVNSQYSIFFEGANFTFRTITPAVSSRNLTVNSSTVLGLVNGNWYHLAVTFDGSVKKIYVNGSLKAQQSDPHTLRTGQSGQIIGAFGGGGGYFFNGKMDEIRVWNKVRTQTEIFNAAFVPIRGDETGLISLYHFNETTGSIVYDATINANAGTKVNSPTTGPSDAMYLIPPIQLVGNSENESVTLAWTPITSATKYYIYSGLETSPADLIDSTTNSFYTVDELTNGIPVFIRLKSGNSVQETSDFSDEIVIVPSDGIGGMVTFNGTDQFAEISNNGNFDFAIGTVELWVRPDFSMNQLGYNPSVLALRNASNDTRWSIHIHNSLQEIDIWNGSAVYGFSYTFQQGNWYHIAMVNDGSTLEIFVNGETVGITPGSFGANFNLPLHMGASSSSGEFFPGSIDEVRIWSVPKLGEAIAETMLIPASGNETNLIGLWQFNEAENETIFDGSPKQNHGSLINTPTRTFSEAMNPESVPVELVSFKVVKVNGTITLHWSTLTETNNAGFDIQRKTSGEWKSLGFVAGKGTTVEFQSYSFVDRDISAGKTAYRLKQIDADGNFSYTSVQTVDITPETFELLGNYPNPFNPTTMIKFQTPISGDVKITVFDVLGREVAILTEGFRESGNHTLEFNAKGLSTGIYFVKMESGHFTSTKKMMLLK